MQLQLHGAKKSSELWAVEATLKYASYQAHDAEAPFDQMPRDVIVQSLPYTMDMPRLYAKEEPMNGMTRKAIRARLADPKWDDRTVRLAHSILYRVSVKGCKKTS